MGRGWYIEGIEVKKECKLLGVIVDNKVKNLAGNWEKCITKISGLINYWNQFNLTITGSQNLSPVTSNLLTWYYPDKCTACKENRGDDREICAS